MSIARMNDENLTLLQQNLANNQGCQVAEAKIYYFWKPIILHYTKKFQNILLNYTTPQNGRKWPIFNEISSNFFIFTQITINNNIKYTTLLYYINQKKNLEKFRNRKIFGRKKYKKLPGKFQKNAKKPYFRVNFNLFSSN